MKCILCNTERLTESNLESTLIPGAKYVTCNGCGNVMILSDGVLIPTPTEKNEMTKAMIEDAAQAFSQNGTLLAASLTSKVCEPDMQPSTVQQLMQDYVNQFICDAHCDCHDEEEDELLGDYCDDCFEGCSNCEEGCSDFEDLREDAVRNNQPILTETIERVSFTSGEEKKDYLLILANGEKRLCFDCSKTFLLEIMNTINGPISLFELNEIKLKQEVRYNF